MIERAGQILIGQRPKGDWNQMKWEFPGGKMEPAESPREALPRELREELEHHAEIGDEITRYQYQYPGKPPIQLIFFRVVQFEGEPRNQLSIRSAGSTWLDSPLTISSTATSTSSTDSRAASGRRLLRRPQFELDASLLIQTKAERLIH